MTIVLNTSTGWGLFTYLAWSLLLGTLIGSVSAAAFMLCRYVPRIAVALEFIHGALLRRPKDR